MLTSFVLPVICLFPLVADDAVLVAAKPSRAPVAPESCSTNCQVRSGSNPRSRLTKVYRLEYVDVTTAAGQVNDAMQKLVKTKPRHDGLVIESPVVVIPEAASNSLIVSAERRYASMIESMLQELDDPGERILVQATITRTSADGKEHVISRPQIMTLDGNKAVVSVGQKDGEQLTLELTPYIVKPVQASRH